MGLSDGMDVLEDVLWVASHTCLGEVVDGNRVGAICPNTSQPIAVRGERQVGDSTLVEAPA